MFLYSVCSKIAVPYLDTCSLGNRRFCGGKKGVNGVNVESFVQELCI